jgi:hypothetical protein
MFGRSSSQGSVEFDRRIFLLDDVGPSKICWFWTSSVAPELGAIDGENRHRIAFQINDVVDEFFVGMNCESKSRKKDR